TSAPTTWRCRPTAASASSTPASTKRNGAPTLPHYVWVAAPRGGAGLLEAARRRPGLGKGIVSGFVLKRVLQAVFVLLVVTLFVSYAVRLTGDPALMLSQGAGSVTEQDLANIRKGLGLDRPFLVQYGEFVRNALHGDLGNSFMG